MNPSLCGAKPPGPMILARPTPVVPLLLLALSACSPPADETDNLGGAAGGPRAGDPFDVPIDGVTDEEARAFFDGDALFGVPLHEADGLGPLYIRSACASCHERGGRGPGSVQKMASADPGGLPWGNAVRPLLAAGATTPVLPPGDPYVRVSVRVGPPIIGRGYLEAVDDAEILRVAEAQGERRDGIRGRVNHVAHRSEPNPDPTFNAHRPGDTVIGRFGLKARIATLDDFTADALQGDMGVTSPLRPRELPNPDGLEDDGKPGVDVGAESVNLRAGYMRLTAIPRRDALSPEGRALFETAQCAACHVPSMKTHRDYPIPLLAGIEAPIYTDLLLHDMGEALSDGVVDGEAGSRDWRTAPLIGLRFYRTFLHDGRAGSVEEAILLHGGEAAKSVSLFEALPERDRAALLAFVNAL